MHQGHDEKDNAVQNFLRAVMILIEYNPFNQRACRGSMHIVVLLG